MPEPLQIRNAPPPTPGGQPARTLSVTLVVVAMLLAAVAMVTGPARAHQSIGASIHPPAAGAPGPWLSTYAQLAHAQPAGCAPVTIPTLPADVPTRAFVFQSLAGRDLGEPGIVYSRDRIVERLLVLTEDAAGCVHATLTGRLLPLASRAVESPLVNARIPAALGTTPPVAVVADAKSIRNWVELAPESDFRSAAAREWTLLGAYAGALAVLLLVGLGFVAWRPDAFAMAYVVYLVTLLFYQLQALGIGPAWVPFWPEPTHTRLTQAVAIALVVPGIAGVVIAFLRPRRRTALALGGGALLAAAAFFSSAWSTWGYRLGALLLAVLAVRALWLLAQRLRQPDAAPRWFAAGLAAAMVGGGLQATSVAFESIPLPGATSVAFAIGNLLESLCWLVALALTFRAAHHDDRRQLLHAAYDDAVTGLPNRHWLREQIDAALAAAARRPSARRQVLLLDLDDFTEVNTLCGHGGGDAVLRAVGAALRQILEPGEVVGRFAGDEFLLLLRTGQDACAAEGRAGSVLAKLAEPIRCGSREVRLGGSIGMVTLHAGHARVDDVIADAGLAQETARRRGGNRAVRFDPAMRRTLKERERLREELAAALGSQRLVLHYQPVLALDTGRPLGFEALLRWRHPTRGLLPAAQFVPIAAADGMIRELGYRVVRLACAQLQDWQRRGTWCEGEYLSINLAAEQLGDDRLLEELRRAVDAFGIDPSVLRLEIPETALAVDRPELAAWRERLLGQQLLLCLDDFGAGSMPLSPLADLGFDSLKLDPALAAGVMRQGRAQSLVRAGIAVGSQFSCLVVAKGIESREQLDTFQQLGCGYGQGDYLAPVMAAGELEAWLSLWEAERPPHTMSLSSSRPH